MKAFAAHATCFGLALLVRSPALLAERAPGPGVGAASAAEVGPAPGPDANPPAFITAKERPTTKDFYGWKILAVGEVGGLVAAASLVLPSAPLGTVPSTVGFLVGMPAYVLGGPVTHWSYGDFTKGLVSLGGNIIVPLISGFAGQAIRCAPNDAADDCGTRGFLTGFAIAQVTVPLVDALALGWDDVPIDDASLHPDKARAQLGSRRAEHVTVAPSWSLGPKGAIQLGVAGTF